MDSATLTSAERIRLLQIAREAIAEKLGLSVEPVREPLTESLKRHGGAFVTLHRNGQLRGCIGTFRADEPLADVVEAMAVSAAFHDPRFAPVRAAEWDEIDFEISALSPLRKIESVSEIEVGRHGLYVTQGYHSGVLLPQVATEYGWDREEFLRHTCLKAGLPAEAWKEGACIEIFSAEVFGEKERDGKRA